MIYAAIWGVIGLACIVLAALSFDFALTVSMLLLAACAVGRSLYWHDQCKPPSSDDRTFTWHF